MKTKQGRQKRQMEVIGRGRGQKKRNRQKILDRFCSPQEALFLPVQGLEPVVETEQAGLRDCGGKEVGMSPQRTRRSLLPDPACLGVCCRNPRPRGRGRGPRGLILICNLPVYPST